MPDKSTTLHLDSQSTLREDSFVPKSRKEGQVEQPLSFNNDSLGRRTPT